MCVNVVLSVEVLSIKSGLDWCTNIFNPHVDLKLLMTPDLFRILHSFVFCNLLFSMQKLCGLFVDVSDSNSLVSSFVLADWNQNKIINKLILCVCSVKHRLVFITYYSTLDRCRYGMGQARELLI